MFFPAYNDAPSLPGLLERAFSVLRTSVGQFEVIVINDGSTDGTAQVLATLEALYAPALRVITAPWALPLALAASLAFRKNTASFPKWRMNDLKSWFGLTGPEKQSV